MEAELSSLQLSQLGLDHNVFRFQKHHLLFKLYARYKRWRESWKGAAASRVTGPDLAGNLTECTEAPSWCSKSYEGRQVVRADHDPLRKRDPIGCPISSLRLCSDRIVTTLRMAHLLNIFHCDVAPQNLFACDGNVLLNDFGSASRREECRCTAIGTRQHS